MLWSIIRGLCRSVLSGDDDYSQFGDYDNYDPQQEEEEETFAFESSFEKNHQQQQLMQEQEQPAASFSLTDGFPEVGQCETEIKI